jgi:hypothetical protein
MVGENHARTLRKKEETNAYEKEEKEINGL